MLSETNLFDRNASTATPYIISLYHKIGLLEGSEWEECLCSETFEGIVGVTNLVRQDGRARAGGPSLLVPQPSKVWSLVSADGYTTYFQPYSRRCTLIFLHYLDPF